MAQNNFQRQDLGYRDNSGRIGRVSYWIGWDSAVGAETDVQVIALAMQAALNACTNAKNVSYRGALNNALDPSQYGVAAQYANAEQKARLNFLSNSRLRSMTLSIPAPLVSIFFTTASGSGSTGGDEETIDASQTPIVNLLAAMVLVSNTASVTVGPFADPVHSLVIGKLHRVKNQRKITRWTKNPTGTTPA